MYSLIGKHAGRPVLRLGYQRASRGSRLLTRHSGSKPKPKHKAPLDLPGLDQKWKLRWRVESSTEQLEHAVRTNEGKAVPGKYILPMFPYPSGDLHLGHLRVYTISDVLARFRRMQGYEVLHPIGWDAFGLPAENAAIARGVDPATWTQQNIQKMKTQLEAMNGAWDWNREFATCDPKFYKHTQQLFLMLHKAGLAYQSEALVNYDPVDKTVLANEQVDAKGHSWRSGAKVEKKMLKQWFFKISAFRQELLDGLTKLQGKWPERVLAMQKNWIGKSTGARIKFPVVAYDQQTHSDIEVFTTRPDTLFGVQYVALASTHPLVQSLANTDAELQAFLNTIPALPQDSKVGYLLPHVHALNPLSYEDSTPDATKASLPIYVAPYVLGDYGDGAVMGVPGHDTRDHSFWKHNRYDDPIRFVVAQSPGDTCSVLQTVPFVNHGHLTNLSGPFAGLSSAAATDKIVALVASKGLGSAAETWRLRDWLVSRQRYWGTPIPIIHCDTCGPVPVPDDQLPVELPPVSSHWEAGETGNPLEHAHEWVNTTCPGCGAAAKRDTDTMDTFVDSSWYFMRFPDAHNSDSLFSPEAADANLPVDLYVGGVEHAILHLLYARFISKFMATTPFWPEGVEHLGEPFKTVLAQGMVHGKTYSDPATGRFLKPDEVNLSDPSQPSVIASNQIANVSFEKMSKSKYNGVDPGTCIAKYGADATRAHILFQAPVSEVLEWDEAKIAGVTRWLHKLHGFIENNAALWFANDLARPDFNPKAYFMKAESAPNNNHSLSSQMTKEWVASLDYLAPARLEEVASYYAKDSRLSKTPSEAAQSAENLRNLWTDAVSKDKAVWRSVQLTVASVTESYSKTYALNTVVSDLMALTNTIMDYHNTSIDSQDAKTSQPDYLLSLHATRALVQMMAPIAPAFAEECWTLVRPSPSITRLQVQPAPGSIFKHAFPTVDGTYALLTPSTHKCAVQINGKVRAVVMIPRADDAMTGRELEAWTVEQILQTKDGREKFTGGGPKPMDIRKAKKTIVVSRGKTVNFVI
ncbi:uncharacterized protein L3040_008468 [Drepanopeziza brunnea f. sp. 'multigermtubi']|nr:hypothetical protein L3040_008468 [Drepanopeziza brunnea f. sp. 'multigermtubi']